MDGRRAQSRHSTRLTISDRAGLAGFSPAYFGMVMATGIVGLAAWFLAMPDLAHALFTLNIAIYLVIWVSRFCA